MGVDESVTQAGLDALIAGGIAEDFDLDYKREPYGQGDSAKRDLATDVAAMANTAGGAILIGVAEDEHARAASLSPVSLADEQLRRIHQIVASGVAPVPAIEIAMVPGASPDQGVMAILVAPSDNAPHAVSMNSGWRYPVRQGATTRYLSESEIAAAYDNRRGSALARRQALDQVWSECTDTLDTLDFAWLGMCLVPVRPGRAAHDSAAWRTFDERIRQVRPMWIHGGNESISQTAVGQGWFGANGGTNANDETQWVAWRLYQDGSAFLAIVGGTTRTRDGITSNLIIDERLAGGLLGGIPAIATLAQRHAGIVGQVQLRSGIVGPDSSVDAYLGHDRGYLSNYHAKPVRVPPSPIDQTVPLDALTIHGPRLVQVAATALHGIGQHYGVVELGQFSAAGEIRLQYFSPSSREQIKNWADAHEIRVSDDHA
jgi:hypothetical protein